MTKMSLVRLVHIITLVLGIFGREYISEEVHKSLIQVSGCDTGGLSSHIQVLFAVRNSKRGSKFVYGKEAFLDESQGICAFIFICCRCGIALTSTQHFIAHTGSECILM